MDGASSELCAMEGFGLDVLKFRILLLQCWNKLFSLENCISADHAVRV